MGMPKNTPTSKQKQRGLLASSVCPKSSTLQTYVQKHKESEKSKGSIPKPTFPWAPWAGWPPRHWANHTRDLAKLTAAVATKSKWVSYMGVNANMARFVLNAIYSIRHLGGGQHVLVAALDKASLDLCLDVGLACYDARDLMAKPAAQHWRPGDPPPAKYSNMVWANVDLPLRILKLGYNVHFSDADVVYLRDIHRSYSPVFERFGSDAIYMSESRSSRNTDVINCGVFAAKSNPRTIRMVEKWYDGFRKLNLTRNQLYFHSLNKDAYVLCNKRGDCDKAKRAGIAALTRHPQQFDEWKGCPWLMSEMKAQKRSFCDSRFLFVHFICSFKYKVARMHDLQLWLVDDCAKRRFLLPRAPAVSTAAPYDLLTLPSSAQHEEEQDLKEAQKANPDLQEHPFLPCKERVAWTDTSLWQQHGLGV